MKKNNFNCENSNLIFAVEKNFLNKINEAKNKFKKLGYNTEKEEIHLAKDNISKLIGEKTIYLDDWGLFDYKIKIFFRAGYDFGNYFHYYVMFSFGGNPLGSIKLNKKEIIECFTGGRSIEEALKLGIIKENEIKEIKESAKRVFEEYKLQRILNKENKLIIKTLKSLADFILNKKGQKINK